MLSQVPQDMVLQLCGSYSAAELSPPGPGLAELRQAQAAGRSLSLYMEESVQELLRDAAERFKGWMSMPGPQHTELACRKVSSTLPVAAAELGEFAGQAGRSRAPSVALCLGLILDGVSRQSQGPSGPENLMRPGALCWASPAGIPVPKPHCRHISSVRAEPHLPYLSAPRPCGVLTLARLCSGPG